MNKGIGERGHWCKENMAVHGLHCFIGDVKKLTARKALGKLKSIDSEVSEGSKGSLKIRLDAIHVCWQEPAHFLCRSWQSY